MIMKKIDYYKKRIEKKINSFVTDFSLVSNANNIVFKFNYNEECYFAKFYCNENGTHIDNEILLYKTIPKEGKKYLKELILFDDEFEYETFAIFKEVKGKLLSKMLIEGEITNEMCNTIADSLIDYFKIVSTIKSKNYGKLSNCYEAKYLDFLEFLHDYQINTINTLSKNEKTIILTKYPLYLLDKYSEILHEGYSCVTPIDSNFNNIIITDDGKIKIIDPGAIISAPINMGLGELVAHSYGTIIYEKLIERLNATSVEIQRLSVYAVLSLLNIMAFLVRNNIGEIEQSKPFGNDKTFFDLIYEHLKIIEAQDLLLKNGQTNR